MSWCCGFHSFVFISKQDLKEKKEVSQSKVKSNKQKLEKWASQHRPISIPKWLRKKKKKPTTIPPVTRTISGFPHLVFSVNFCNLSPSYDRLFRWEIVILNSVYLFFYFYFSSKPSLFFSFFFSFFEGVHRLFWLRNIVIHFFFFKD